MPHPRYTPGSRIAILLAIALLTSAPRARAQDGDDAPSKHLTVMCDFNRDGIPDMAEATLPAPDHTGPNFLTISLGQPNGTFKQTAKLALGDHPRDIVTGDFNQDSNPDLIVGDDNGALVLLLGDGTGNLTPSGEIAHLKSVVSIAVADFNHDGIPDLVVSDWRGSTVTVFLGTGKGTFHGASAFSLHVLGATPHVSAADFNGDGIPDFVVVYGEGDDITYDVMVGDGSGGFTFAPQLSLIKDPNSRCPS